MGRQQRSLIAPCTSWNTAAAGVPMLCPGMALVVVPRRVVCPLAAALCKSWNSVPQAPADCRMTSQDDIPSSRRHKSVCTRQQGAGLPFLLGQCRSGDAPLGVAPVLVGIVPAWGVVLP